MMEYSYKNYKYITPEKGVDPTEGLSADRKNEYYTPALGNALPEIKNSKHREGPSHISPLLSHSTEHTSSEKPRFPRRTSQPIPTDFDDQPPQFPQIGRPGYHAFRPPYAEHDRQPSMHLLYKFLNS